MGKLIARVIGYLVYTLTIEETSCLYTQNILVPKLR